MRRMHGSLNLLVLASALISPVMLDGSAARASYHTYDPYYTDYHRWDDHETTYYVQWEAETHREHPDFEKRDKNEQKEYWDWRHNHSDDGHR
jgi:hypothetical protein